MGQHKTPTQSETSLFHTRGQKMEPTRPADSWVSHLFDHSCGKEMSPLFRWSFIKRCEIVSKSKMLHVNGEYV